MKYFKFAQISAETGVSWAIAQPASGPSWPNIPGLELSDSIQLSHSPLYYIARVDDSAVPDPDNHIFEISLEEYAEELKNRVVTRIDEERASIYKQEYDFRNSMFSKYHDTASIAGIYKYEQAKALLIDPTAEAKDVRAEASARGVAADVMAQRIVENHESFRAKEAKIAGIRGKIMDRLDSFVFDDSDPHSSYKEANSTEVIGKAIGSEFENGEVDVVVEKYRLSLATRFAHE